MLRPYENLMEVVMAHAKKIPLIGLDVIPEFAEKFMADGAMPNLNRLKESGFYTDAIPCVPAWTPGNWVTQGN